MTDLSTDAACSTTAIDLDPLRSAADTAAVNRAVRISGPYGPYAAVPSSGPRDSKVAERYDAARNDISTGGSLGGSEPPATSIRRTGYSRLPTPS